MMLPKLTNGSLYQNAMAKQVSEKYSELNTQANAMVEGANKEISNLTARLEGEHVLRPLGVIN